MILRYQKFWSIISVLQINSSSKFTRLPIWRSLKKCPFQESRSDENEVLVFTRIKHLRNTSPTTIKMVRRQYKHLVDLENGSQFKEIFLDQNGHKLGGDWEQDFKDTLVMGWKTTNNIRFTVFIAGMIKDQISNPC